MWLLNIFRHICSFILLCCIISPLWAQDSASSMAVIIHHSDIVRGVDRDAEDVRILLGNVHLQNDSTEIYTDTTYHYTESNYLYAYGNVEIIESNMKLWADTAYYYLEDKKALLFGRVIIYQDDVILWSNAAELLIEDDTSRFQYDIYINHVDYQLNAQYGWYDRNQKTSSFWDDVVFLDSNGILICDSLYVNEKDNIQHFIGNVYGMNSEQDELFKSQSLDIVDSVYVLKNDVLIQRNKWTDEDTLWIVGEYVKTYQKHGFDYFWAKNKVRFWLGNISLVADSAYYNGAKEQLFLYGNASIWRDDMQLTGQEIEIQFKDGDIANLFVPKNPFLAVQDSINGQIHQFVGNTLTMLFDEETNLEYLIMKGDTKVLYFTNDDDNKLNGAIQMAGDSSRVSFQNSAVDTFYMYSDIIGTRIPKDKSITTDPLRGYIWTPEARPQKSTILPTMKQKPKLQLLPEEFPKRYVLFTDG